MIWADWGWHIELKISAILIHFIVRFIIWQSYRMVIMILLKKKSCATDCETLLLPLGNCKNFSRCQKLNEPVTLIVILNAHVT